MSAISRFLGMIATRGSAAVVLATAGLSLLPTGTFGLDRAGSRVEFFVRDNRGGFTGVVHDVEATANVREQGSSFVAHVEVRINARTITTGVGLRDRQMRQDFLQTDRFPFISFVGTAAPVDRVGALPFPGLLKGRLTIKQTTREVEVPIRITALKDTYLAEGQTVLRMSDFQIPIPRFLIFVAEDPVTLTLKVHFKEK